jgi:ABC-type transporter Mla subunit MlaD
MLEETMASMSGEVASGGKLMREAMVEALDQLLQMIDERTEATRNAIAETMANAHHALTEESNRTTEAMQSVARDAAASLADLRSVIDEHGDQFLNALAERGAGAIAELRDTHRELIEELGGTLGRVQETNSALHDMLGSVGSTLADMENNLSTRGEALRAVVQDALADTNRTGEEMARQATALRDAADSALSDLGTIAERIERDGQFLATTVERFEGDAERFDSRMDERRQALEDLSQNLMHKSEQVDSLMRSFTERVEDQLRNTEARVHDARDLLERTLEETARGVTPQLEHMHEAASAEAERIRENLRVSNEAMAAEMVEALQQVAQRFETATEDMRRSARAVQDEFESTRSALERSVVELPEETVQNAEALRRAVTEQLDAVRELGAIVARHAGSAETARAPAMAAEEGGRETYRRSSERRLAEPARRETPAREPGNGRAGRFEREGGGWMNGPSRRAADPLEEEEEAPASRMPLDAGLGRLAKSASRAIDDGTYRDLWARFNRGERQIFTRQLYTLDGQQTFEDVRRRYQRDRDFRGQVDRYVDEFEEMIAEAARNDSSGRRTRDTLMSDDGKLYTLLAHASGRLG